MGIDASRAVGCRQIHSDLVRVACEEDAGKILWNDRPYDADGLITNVPNLPLFAYGSDCCVITLYDPTSRSIGAVHAGWRGTAAGIALKAAVSMMSCYGADPYTLRAAIGPSIGKCCFETDRDVADAFALLDPAMDERIEQRGDKFHIDLKEINRLWCCAPGSTRAHRRSPRLTPNATPSATGRTVRWAKARRHGRDDLPDGGYAVKRRLAALLCALALSLARGLLEQRRERRRKRLLGRTAGAGSGQLPLTPITSFALPYLQGVTLDPLTCPDGIQQVLGALLYEGLFALDESFAPQNVLCSRYERSDDGTSYTFLSARRRQLFRRQRSDGKRRACHAPPAHSRASATARASQMSPQCAQAAVRSSSPSRAQTAPSPHCLIFPSSRRDRKKAPYRSAPGRISSSADGDGAFLKRSADWHGGALPFERIELRAAKDTDTAAYLFSSREVHLLLSDLTSGTGIFAARRSRSPITQPRT